ncbi:NFX1-type zinc finger-containing protein 1-like protein [Corchorus olitorius]|uniref:NFX1-type zinc finger-containing protein 1-like protein n=1 Tax=Corchorus olitorius TaxID=93759 RepID=A0A1R3KWC0_9ROSI|nr:NFX1-type zinc finger-containing protein 1-like protein [Corchorus olitorius]
MATGGEGETREEGKIDPVDPNAWRRLAQQSKKRKTGASTSNPSGGRGAPSSGQQGRGIVASGAQGRGTHSAHQGRGTPPFHGELTYQIRSRGQDLRRQLK